LTLLSQSASHVRKHVDAESPRDPIGLGPRVILDRTAQHAPALELNGIAGAEADVERVGL